MSLYDDASLISLPTGAGGRGFFAGESNDTTDTFKYVGKVYSMKPVPKVKDTELVTNGSFETDSDWTKTSNSESTATISGGRARLTAEDNGNSYAAIIQQDVFSSGKTYRIIFDVELIDGSLKLGYSDAGVTDSDFEIGQIRTTGKHTFYYTCPSSSAADELRIARHHDPCDAYINSVSVKEVEVEPVDLTLNRATNVGMTRVKSDGKIEKGRENLLHFSNRFNETDTSVDQDRQVWTKSNVTLTSGQLGYDGTNNAWKLETNNTNGLVSQAFSGTTGVKTFSFYAKKGTTDGVVIRVDPVDDDPLQIEFYVNLNDGSYMTGSDGNQNPPKIFNKIEDVGSGWYRISITFDEDDNGIDEVKIILASHDAGASPVYSTTVVQNGNIYIQHAQLEQGLIATPYIDKAGDQLERYQTEGIKEDEPRFDYRNGDCPGWLIEREATNLFAYSEYLEGEFGTIRSTFLQNKAMSPEGFENAAKVLETATGVDGGASQNPPVPSTHGFQKIDIDIDDGKFYSYSFFVKASGRTKLLVQHSNDSTLDTSVTVDLSGTPSVTEGRAGATGTQSIVDYGDGWYRVEINGREGLADDADSNLNFFFHNGTQTDYLGDVTKGFFFYGFQFEEGKVCTSYIPTHGAAVTRRADEVKHLIDTTKNGITNDYNTTFYIKARNLNRNGLTRLFNYASTTSSGDPRLLCYLGEVNSDDECRVYLQYRVGDASDDDLLIISENTAEKRINLGDIVKVAARISDTGVTLFVNGDKYTYADDGHSSGKPFLKSKTGRSLEVVDLSNTTGDQGHEIHEFIIFPKTLTDDEIEDLTTL